MLGYYRAVALDLDGTITSGGPYFDRSCGGHAGDSGTGKLYVTGLLAEQMINLGYSVLLIDPEGDHTGLGSLPNTLLVWRYRQAGVLRPRCRRRSSRRL
ncbi:MAG: hypothetical protein ACRDTH_27545 [Pseudonocardiaceae bacterium]